MFSHWPSQLHCRSEISYSLVSKPNVHVGPAAEICMPLSEVFGTSSNFSLVVQQIVYTHSSANPIMLLSLSFLLVKDCFAQLKQCYGFAGEPVQDFPCDPSANVSACCGPLWTCSNNLYCTEGNNDRIIGSCTDTNFQDAACPLILSQSIGFWLSLPQGSS